MFEWLKGLVSWGRSKELKDYLGETRKLKVNGIRFEVRRLNIHDYLDGSKTLTAYYELYQSGKVQEAEANLKKVREHYKDVFMASVVSPKLKRKDDPADPAIFVEEITNDLSMSSRLYVEIIAFTDGKKKAKF